MPALTGFLCLFSSSSPFVTTSLRMRQLFLVRMMSRRPLCAVLCRECCRGAGCVGRMVVDKTAPAPDLLCDWEVARLLWARVL